MKTIVIDENYKGVRRTGYFFRIDEDIIYPQSRIDIKIPLISTKSIVGESLRAVGWLEVVALRVGGTLRVFGARTLKYAYLLISTYSIIFTSSYIKIGDKLYKVEEWQNFTDDEIAKMDTGTLEWWKKWKNFILSTHKNLVEVYGVVE